MTWAKREHKRCDRETDRQTSRQRDGWPDRVCLSVWSAHCHWTCPLCTALIMVNKKDREERTLIVPKLHKRGFELTKSTNGAWAVSFNCKTSRTCPALSRQRISRHDDSQELIWYDTPRYAYTHTHTHMTNNLHFISVYLMHQLSLLWHATTENPPPFLSSKEIRVAAWPFS